MLVSLGTNQHSRRRELGRSPIRFSCALVDSYWKGVLRKTHHWDPQLSNQWRAFLTPSTARLQRFYFLSWHTFASIHLLER